MKFKKIFTLLITLGLIITHSCFQKIYALDTSSSSELILKIEEDLKSKGTSVEKELTELKNENLNDNIDNAVLDDLKEDFNNFSLEKKESIYSVNVKRASSIGNTINHGPVVAAVIAWFSASGYKLSAELLTHMRSNKKINSSYTPKNGYVIKSSRTIKRIANATKTKGSDVMQNIGSTAEKDCYYAIHKFNFTKPSAKSKTVNVSDRYDFANSGISSIANFAITAMYSAQLSGYLKPFYTKTTVRM